MLFCPFIPLTKLEPTRARLCFSSNHDESWTTLLVELKIFPVSLVPRAAVSGSEVIQHLGTKMII